MYIKTSLDAKTHFLNYSAKKGMNNVAVITIWLLVEKIWISDTFSIIGALADRLKDMLVYPWSRSSMNLFAALIAISLE